MRALSVGTTTPLPCWADSCASLGSFRRRTVAGILGESFEMMYFLLRASIATMGKVSQDAELASA